MPLAQAFGRGDGEPVVIVANHFKSKGCSEASGADADRNGGQACSNVSRVESARRLDAWMKTDPTGTGSPLQLLVGDFNAYAMEDPMRALHDAGWQDAFAVAGMEQPYSYVYAGLSGRLDHALLSPGLAARLRRQRMAQQRRRARQPGLCAGGRTARSVAQLRPRPDAAGFRSVARSTRDLWRCPFLAA